MIRKILIVSISFVALVIVAFIILMTDIPFKLWPTYLHDHDLDVTDQMLTQLQEFRSEKKFTESPDNFLYPGLHDEPERLRLEGIMNESIDRIIEGLPEHPEKSFVLKEFKRTLPEFRSCDSEERDRVCLYCEQIMGIVGIKSSEKLLNIWRYGLPI